MSTSNQTTIRSADSKQYCALWARIGLGGFLVSLTLICSCKEPPTAGNLSELVVQTDKSHYSVGETISFYIQNYSQSNAYFGHCGERIIFLIGTKEGGRWVHTNGWGWPCLAIFSMGVTTLSPESVYTDMVTIHQAGTYRIFTWFGWHSDSTLADSIFSNEFPIQ